MSFCFQSFSGLTDAGVVAVVVVAVVGCMQALTGQPGSKRQRHLSWIFNNADGCGVYGNLLIEQLTVFVSEQNS